MKNLLRRILCVWLGMHYRTSTGRGLDGSVVFTGPCVRCGEAWDSQVVYPNRKA